MHLKLENFDGPLDLLLYLIKTQDINIFDIPISHITLQFLSFIKQAGKLDIHLAGDYLAMAAQLIEIKTNSLLPTLQNKDTTPNNLEEILDSDPRKPLVEQLLEFEVLRKASEALAQKSALFAEIYPTAEYKRRSEELSSFEQPIHGNPFDLAIIFEKVLLKYTHIKTLPKVVVETQKISIEQKMLEVVKKVGDNENPLNFKELILECQSRYELIVLLMSVLELCQTHQLMLQQSNEFEDIYILHGERFPHHKEETLNIKPANID